MKYESNTKVSRNEAIVKLRKAGVTFQGIADTLGMTRQRVHFIYNRTIKK